MYKISEPWKNLVSNDIGVPKYSSRTCRIFNSTTKYSCKEDEQCACGRMIRRHSFDGESLEDEAKKRNQIWTVPNEFRALVHSAKVPVNVFGTLMPSNCNFIRVDVRTRLRDIYQLILEDCEKQKPTLMISFYGGTKYTTMTGRLKKEFIRGLVNAAVVANGWIVTTGIDNGVSKLVGEGIANHRLLREYPNRVRCIGLTMWSTMSEEMRLQLKHEAKDSLGLHKLQRLKGVHDNKERQIPDAVQFNNESIETNHSHCILFDSGSLMGNLSDAHRDSFVKEVLADQDNDHPCYAVTIMVDGDFGSLEVLQNDIQAHRPIVLIQGSGRLADVLALLIETTSDSNQSHLRDPSDEEVAQVLDQFIPNDNDDDRSFERRQIKAILQKDNRYLLHVFDVDRDKHVAETIFNAIFTVTKRRKELEHKNKKDKSSKDDTNRQQDEDQLVELIDLALEWDYFDGVRQILQAREFSKEYNSRNLNKTQAEEKKLFVKSLEKNRPKFVEYFLAAGFDVLSLAYGDSMSLHHIKLLDLYRDSYHEMSQNHKKRIDILIGKSPISTVEQLDTILSELLGACFRSIHSSGENTLLNRFQLDSRNCGCTCCVLILEGLELCINNTVRKSGGESQPNRKYTKDEILRDLFLWSILMDMPEMAKILLLHVRSRICAALVASAIFKVYSVKSPTADLRDKFQNQSSDFATYAAMCINKCYECDERLACELLFRQVHLFGDITCIQIAVFIEDRKLLGTACFDAAVDLMLAILSLGFLAPIIVTYKKEEGESWDDMIQTDLSDEGINYYMNKKASTGKICETYWTRFMNFHECPIIKMSYHFLSYIWFLLLFSYMMLYHLDSRNNMTQPHWSEIYVIITVSTMLIDEVRKWYLQYRTRMMEQWGSTGSTILTVSTIVFYILPYFLFFLGLGFRYGSYNDALLSTARIIWALDLELWYLNSLKFAMALKLLGPKLFMLKNMLRELFAFVYVIFIAMTAYGVVSRSLFLYNQVPFTGQGIFSEILYKPYWFMFGVVADKDTLDNIINGTGNDASAPIAEATATHVLLAFQMLFVNILLLNLLIAVFTFTIDKVQENTEFYWRCQRYTFVREYFERIPLAYPPLIIIPHFILLILAIRYKCCSKLRRSRIFDQDAAPLVKKFKRIFKMISLNSTQDERWQTFENAATQNYFSWILEKCTITDGSNRVSGIPEERTSVANGKTANAYVDPQLTVNNLRSELITEFNSSIRETQRKIEQMQVSLEWMMTAMERVKMNKSDNPKPQIHTLGSRRDVISMESPMERKSESHQ